MEEYNEINTEGYTEKEIMKLMKRLMKEGKITGIITKRISK